MASQTPAMVWVKAREGVRVARENAPRQYIASSPTRVHLTAYYQRQIADRDLMVVDEPLDLEKK